MSPCFVPPSPTGSQVYDVKLFPLDPVELIAGETLTLNCTALVEFNTGLEIHWSYPGKLVHPGSTLDKQNPRFGNPIFRLFPRRQTNSCVETKPYRETLSHATEVASILTIHKVNVNDTGSYSCNVSSTDMTKTQQTQVLVYGE